MRIFNGSRNPRPPPAVKRESSMDVDFCVNVTGVLSTGQKIRQDKQDEQDYFVFHHGKS